MLADKAYIQRLAALGEFASRLNQFNTNNRGTRTEIVSAVGARISELMEMQSRMENRRAMAASALASARDAYRRCMDYHRDDENPDPGCCSYEAREVERLEAVLEKIEECCANARQLVMEARTHSDTIASMVNVLNGSIDSLCTGGAAALHGLTGKAESYRAAKSHVDPIQMRQSPVLAVRQGTGTAAGSASPAAMLSDNSPFRILSPLTDHYAVEQSGRRIVVYDPDTTGCIARVSPSDEKGVAILSFFAWKTHGDDGSLDRIEAFLLTNGFDKYNSWVENDEKEYFLRQGFTVKKNTASVNGCVVEKTIHKPDEMI